MERKNVNAILVNDFEAFLKKQDLYDDFVSGKILCSQCKAPINSENIAMIYYQDGYKFCCDKTDCLEEMR